MVQRVVVDRLIAEASRPDLRPDLRAEIEWTLRHDLGDRLEAMESSEDRETLAHVTSPVEPALPAEPPPGSPIGAAEIW